MFKQIAIYLCIASSANMPGLASKCYGERDCAACHTCNYCKDCNSGGTLCGVYYKCRGETPPWEQKKSKPTPKPDKRSS